MLLFAYGLDPYLVRLQKSLKGILIYARYMPVFGPLVENEAQPTPILVEERLTAFAYADDVKNAVTSTEEFILVDEETKIFERASGCELHRDPTSDKVKVMPIGNWKNTLHYRDMPPQCAHIKVSDYLDMLGVTLYPNKMETVRVNGEDMQQKIKTNLT